MDPIDQAIAQANLGEPISLTVTVGDAHKPIIIVVPSTLDGDELMELIAWMAAQRGFRTMLAKALARPASSGIVALDGSPLS